VVLVVLARQFTKRSNDDVTNLRLMLRLRLTLRLRLRLMLTLTPTPGVKVCRCEGMQVEGMQV